MVMTSDSNEQATNVPRRTLVKGAAWTVPILATALAAPSAVASCGGNPSALAIATTMSRPNEAQNGTQSGLPMYNGTRTLTYTATYTVTGSSMPAGSTFAMRIAPVTFWDQLGIVSVTSNTPGQTVQYSGPTFPTETFNWITPNGCQTANPDTRTRVVGTLTAPFGPGSFTVVYTAQLRGNTPRTGAGTNPMNYYQPFLTLTPRSEFTPASLPCITTPQAVGTGNAYVIGTNGTCT